MLGELAVIVIILMTVALTYLKGTTVKSFIFLINTLIAAVIAFSYYETLGRLIIGYDILPNMVYGAVLLIVFALVSAILNTIAVKLMKDDIYFGDVPDKIIKCFIALFSGFAIAGVILTAAALLPLDPGLPYQRFASKTQSTQPQKTLILNADGFITNFVSLISRGSMSGQKSFAVFHPRLLDEMYLNRNTLDNDILSYTKSSIVVDAAIAPQTQLISTKDNKPINQGSQTKPVIIKTRLDGTYFAMSQVRLICKSSDSAGSPRGEAAGNLTGSGQVFWPTGYITRDNIVELRTLSDKGRRTQVDFVFYIPVNMAPVLLEYKQTAIAEIGKLKVQPLGEQTPAQQPAAK